MYKYSAVVGPGDAWHIMLLAVQKSRRGVVIFSHTSDKNGRKS